MEYPASASQEWQFSLTERQTTALCAAMLRSLYQRVFECVLGHVNAALSFPESQSQNVIRFIESSGPVNVRAPAYCLRRTNTRS